MSKIDWSKVQEGDTVTVRFRVSGKTNASFDGVTLVQGYRYVLAKEDVESHEPAPYAPKVGDRVRVIGHGTYSERVVLGVHEDKVWTVDDIGTGDYGTYPVWQIKLVR